MFTLAQVNALLEAGIDAIVDSPTGPIALLDGLAYRIEFDGDQLVWLDTPPS